MASLNIISLKAAASKKPKSPREPSPFTIHIDNTDKSVKLTPINFSDYVRPIHA